MTLTQDGDDVVVEVADDGPGLPPEEIDQVFKPFFRGSGALEFRRARRRPGAGGLAFGLTVARL